MDDAVRKDTFGGLVATVIPITDMWHGALNKTMAHLRNIRPNTASTSRNYGMDPCEEKGLVSGQCMAVVAQTCDR